MNDLSTQAMEPMVLPVGSSPDLDDLVFELVRKASLLKGQIAPPVQQQIGRLVRSMNCYYSNFIEGHQTHPRDIERALDNDFAGNNQKQRDLKEEARAHIALQERIDGGTDDVAWPTTEQYIKWLHREFCSRLPRKMLLVKSQDSEREVEVVPGEYRRDIVGVGLFRALHPRDLQPFMQRFEQAYDPSRLSKPQLLLSTAASHHRLLWIHPFLDGNGRVARLMSHALLLRLGVGSSLWSVSRGLARNVEQYKLLLSGADTARANDYDGRGSLSLAALKEFTKFFLTVCIDQVDFMATLLQPSEILRRIELYARDEVEARRLPRGSFQLLREAFHGEVPRGKAPEITGYEERRARETVSVLLERGLLVSKGPRAPLTLSFPIDVLERWLPALYPVDAPTTLT